MKSGFESVLLVMSLRKVGRDSMMNKSGLLSYLKSKDILRKFLEIVEQS
jgi:hypothetical protein